MAGLDSQTIPFSVQGYLDTLKKSPGNVPARTAIIKQNVADMQTKLNVSPKQAGAAVKTTMSLYAYSKGIDPQSVLDTLTTDEQTILDYSKEQPTVFGMDIATALKMGQLATGISGIFLVVSIGCFAVALFTVGPEAAAAIAGAGSVVEAMGLISGSPLIIVGGMAFILSQFFGHFGSNVPLYTKQAIDNGSIGPGLRITALKQAQDIQDKLQGTKAPGSLTSAQFSSLAAGIEANGVKAFSDPFKKQDILYSRKNLADLVSEIYGDLILKGDKATATKLIATVGLYIKTPQSAPVSTPVSVQSSAPTTSTPSTQIFTGVVSSGVLGSATNFTPRPDDLVSSMADLQQAVENNLAPYIASIGKKLIYEVKIQSSITNKDGTITHGQVVKVPNGVTAGGIQKYKTVTSKFAVLNLYILSDKGTRAKITSIVLGPTDAVNFQPAQFELSDLQTRIQTDLFTSNPAVIDTVATSSAPTSTAVGTNAVVVPTPILTPGLFRDVGSFGAELYARVDNRIYVTNLLDKTTFPYLNGIIGGGEQAKVQLQHLKDNYNLDYFSIGVQNTADLFSDPTIIRVGKAGPDGGPDPIFKSVSWADFLALRSTANPEQSPAILAKKAGNLFDFYSIQGLPVPPLDVRGQQYESLGLGQKLLYTGTAEQNTKLLQKLQSLI